MTKKKTLEQRQAEMRKRILERRRQFASMMASDRLNARRLPESTKRLIYRAEDFDLYRTSEYKGQ